MYKVYIGNKLLPVTPSKIQFKIKNQNKTITLVNDEEVNIIKAPGLTEISIECLLPMHEYKFAQYEFGYQPANYFLDQFETDKINQWYFPFIISRRNSKKEVTFNTNILVTLEDYHMIEDSDQGGDILVNIKLKQYIEYGLKTVKIKKDKVGSTKASTSQKRPANKGIPSTYTVQKGDTMWAIAKKLLGDGAKCWNLAKLNGLSNPNRIRIGQVLKIQDVKASAAPSKKVASKPDQPQTSQNSKTSQNAQGFTMDETAVGGMSLALQNASPEALKKATDGLTGSSGYSNLLIDYYNYRQSPESRFKRGVGAGSGGGRSI